MKNLWTPKHAKNAVSLISIPYLSMPTHFWGCVARHGCLRHEQHGATDDLSPGTTYTWGIRCNSGVTSTLIGHPWYVLVWAFKHGKNASMETHISTFQYVA